MWRYVLAILIYLAMAELLAYIHRRDRFPLREDVRKYRQEILYNYWVAPLLGVVQAVELCTRGRKLRVGLQAVVVFAAGGVAVGKILPDSVTSYLILGGIVAVNFISIFAVPPYQPKQEWPTLVGKARR